MTSDARVVQKQFEVAPDNTVAPVHERSRLAAVAALMFRSSAGTIPAIDSLRQGRIRNDRRFASGN